VRLTKGGSQMQCTYIFLHLQITNGRMAKDWILHQKHGFIAGHEYMSNFMIGSHELIAFLKTLLSIT
jgi:hypothetical protein